MIRRIEIIGEAVAHLSEETRRAVPALPFRKMRGMRNLVAHDYANVDVKVVWEVATVHVPEVCRVLDSDRGEAIRIISARMTTRRERKQYEESTEE